MRILLCSLSMLLMQCGSLYAGSVDEPLYKKPRPVALFSWQGLYLGVKLGGILDHVVVSVDSRSTLGRNGSHRPAVAAPSATNRVNMLGGLYGGYNYVFSNRLVVGFETNLLLGERSLSKTALSSFGESQPAHVSSFMKWESSARVRLGYAFNKFLPYVSLGVVGASLEVETSVSTSGDRYEARVLAPQRIDVTMKDKAIGFVAGLGFDYALTDKVLTRFEYNYTSLNLPSTVSAFTDNVERKRFGAHSWWLGLGFKL